MTPIPYVPLHAPKPSTSTLADLGFEAMVLPGEPPSGEIEALFRADRGLRAVVIDGTGKPVAADPGLIQYPIALFTVPSSQDPSP